MGAILMLASLMRRDDRGAVATEYGLILTLVVLVIVVAMTALGVAVSGLIERGSEPL